MTAQSIITAVATGWTRSDRAVIRLSGPGTHTLCSRLFEHIPTEGNAVVATRLRLTDARSLPCLLIRYDGPRSYTGEDAAEIVVPGNPALLERIMALLVGRADVREAQPGEFSARAYLNGRMTLAQAEGVAALIAAGTDEQLRGAAELMSGCTGDRHRCWADEATTLLALVEAGIDFTDQEDVVPIAPPDLAARLEVLSRAIRSELGAAGGTERLTDAPRVVLVGSPNAGKSTLFNALLGRARAMVSPIAGTTRDAIVEELDLSREVACGPVVMLVDLAGLDGAPDDGAGEIARGAQEQARAEIERASIVVLCDPRGRFDGACGAPAGRPVIRVRTKADLPIAERPGEDAIGVCALDGWNLGVLRRAIADAAWTNGAEGRGAAWLLPRHRRALAGACERLEAARGTFDARTRSLGSPELVAGELRGALDGLGELVGNISPDDVIGRVFATFCVGK